MGRIQRLALATFASLTATGLLVNACSDPGITVEALEDVDAAHVERGGFEVWIADQSGTRLGYGAQLLIFEGSDLMGRSASRAQPIARLDLGAETAALCQQTTGRNPTRPHMVTFNAEHTHAVLAFVASGHAVIFDAATRTPINCFESTIGSTGTRQAHAAFPAPDGSFIVVANQAS